MNWNDRDERDEYRGDVWYREWQAGLPEGSISDDRIESGFYDGCTPEGLVGGECRRRSEARQEQEYHEQMYEEQQRQAYEEEMAAGHEEEGLEPDA